MKLLIVNGPNLNMLGRREPEIYGKITLKELEEYIGAYCAANGHEFAFVQSNHEGDLIDAVQSAIGAFDGIVINPGGYAHSSVALLDALKCAGLPAVEVHISDVGNREDFRRVLITAGGCLKVIAGRKEKGYIEAIDFLIDYMDNNKYTGGPAL